MIRERRQHNCTLLESCFAYPFGEVRIGVMLTHVIRIVFLDGREARQSEFGKAQMIRIRNWANHILHRSLRLERLEPRIEDRFGRLVVFHVPTVCRTSTWIVVEIHRQVSALVLFSGPVYFAAA